MEAPNSSVKAPNSRTNPPVSGTLVLYTVNSTYCKNFDFATQIILDADVYRCSESSDARSNIAMQHFFFELQSVFNSAFFDASADEECEIQLVPRDSTSPSLTQTLIKLLYVRSSGFWSTQARISSLIFLGFCRKPSLTTNVNEWCVGAVIGANVASNHFVLHFQRGFKETFFHADVD